MFNYNPKILDLLKGESCVICASVGTGKTQSVKEFVSTTKEKVLVIVNDIKAQEELAEDLDILVYNSEQEGSFPKCIASNKSLTITKAKFNNLLSLDSTAFDLFDRIIIDESSGLSPIVQNNIRDSIKDVSSALESFITKFNEYSFNMYFNVIHWVKRLSGINKYNDDTIVPFYQEEVPLEITKDAKVLIYVLLDAYYKKRLFDTNIKIIPLINFLNALRDNFLYMSDYKDHKGKVHTSVLYANSFLKDFIEKSKAKINILDATAPILEDLYRYLNIPINTIPPRTYPNLYFHIHNYDGVTSAKGRSDEDIAAKILEDIADSGRQNHLTFCIKKHKDLLKENGFNEVDWFMSGTDIGSNKYREETELNVLLSQTHPQSYRALFNRIILGIEDKYCHNPSNLKIAENILMSNNLAQLVGRLKIRQDSNARCDVHFYAISRICIERIQAFYGIPNQNVILYDSKNVGVPKKNVSSEDVSYLIEQELKGYYPNKTIALNRLIRTYFYSLETPSKTITNMIGRIKSKLEELCIKYNAEIEVKRGRNGGTYLIMK